MNKISVLVFIVLFTTTLAVNCKKEEAVSKTKDCKKLWANAATNLEFGAKSECERDNTDKKLNAVYQLVLKQRKDHPDFIKMLKNEQRIWIKMKASLYDYSIL